MQDKQLFMNAHQKVGFFAEVDKVGLISNSCIVSNMLVTGSLINEKCKAQTRIQCLIEDEES